MCKEHILDYQCMYMLIHVCIGTVTCTVYVHTQKKMHTYMYTHVHTTCTNIHITYNASALFTLEEYVHHVALAIRALGSIVIRQPQHSSHLLCDITEQIAQDLASTLSSSGESTCTHARLLGATGQ